MSFVQICSAKAADASITVSASGGTGTLTYTLNPGAVSNTSGNFTGLGPGNYTVTVTDDGRGVAQSVVEQLSAGNGSVALVQLGDGVREAQPGVYQAILTDPIAVSELVAMVRQRHGPIGTRNLTFHGPTTRFSDYQDADFLPDDAF